MRESDFLTECVWCGHRRRPKALGLCLECTARCSRPRASEFCEALIGKVKRLGIMHKLDSHRQACIHEFDKVKEKA